MPSSTLHLRPRGFSELIDATFLIVRARFRVLATGAALIMVPLMVLTLLAMLYMPQAQLQPDGTVAQSVPREMPSFMWAVFPVVFLASIWAFVVGFGSLVHVASQAYRGEAAELAPAITTARARFWTLFRATILKYVLAFVLLMIAAMSAGVLAAIAPVLGIIGALGVVVGVLVLFVMWSMTTPIIMIEGGTGARAALGRSTRLTRGSRLRLVGMAIVLVVIFYAVVGMLMLGGIMLLRSPIAAQVLTNLLSLVMYPVVAALMTVVYYDLRIRGEGFDLEVMAAGLPDGAVLPAAGSAARQTA